LAWRRDSRDITPVSAVQQHTTLNYNNTALHLHTVSKTTYILSNRKDILISKGLCPAYLLMSSIVWDQTMQAQTKIFFTSSDFSMQPKFSGLTKMLLY
jgi:hypothetical protein